MEASGAGLGRSASSLGWEVSFRPAVVFGLPRGGRPPPATLISGLIGIFLFRRDADECAKIGNWAVVGKWEPVLQIMPILIMVASEEQLFGLTLHQIAGWVDERGAWRGIRLACKVGKPAREWYEVTLELIAEKGIALRLLSSKLPAFQEALA